MYTLIYLILKRHLKTHVPELKEVAWYLNQDKIPGGFKISPSLYISFLPTQTRSLPDGVQEGEPEAELRLVTDEMKDNDDRIFRLTGNTHLSLADKIHQKVSGLSGMLSDLEEFEDLKGTKNDLPVFSSIDRTGIESDQEMTSKMTTIQRFRCYAKDYTGNPTYQKLVRDLEISA